MEKLRIAITGATGLIGRNLLCEIIKRNLDHLDKLEILILGRDAGQKDLRSRVFDILNDDGRAYISSDRGVQDMVLKRMDAFIRCVKMDLGKKDFGLSRDDFKILSAEKIEILYHVAGLTDLRQDRATEKKLEEINVRGTARVLDLIAQLQLLKFCYVGTAYSCGNIRGRIAPDFMNVSEEFRNPYERTKLKAEMIVREFAKKSSVTFMYFRPSVTCGRLREEPLGAVNKFDVFYGWGAFFLAAKWKMLAAGADLFETPVSLKARICFKRDGGLNIVPADFVAKAMYCISMNTDIPGSYHVVNEQETPHSLYLLDMIKCFNISGVQQVDEVPVQLNKFEKLYYKTVGRIFTPYISADPMSFDTENFRAICDREGIQCPVIDPQNLSILINYAKKYNFGIAPRDPV